MFQPLTAEQYQKARGAGFSPEKIIEMEQMRKTDTSQQAEPKQNVFSRVGEFLAPTITKSISKLGKGEKLTGRDILGSGLEAASYLIPVGIVGKALGLGVKGAVAGSRALKAAKLAKEALSLGQKVKLGTTIGALSGGSAGAGRAIGEGADLGEIAKQTIGGATLGAGAGAVLPVAFAGAGKAIGGIKTGVGKIAGGIKAIEPAEKSAEIMQRVARIPKSRQAAFKRASGGEDVGQYLTNRDMYGQTGKGSRVEKIMGQIYNTFEKSKTAGDEAMAKFTETFKPKPVKTALKELLAKEKRVSSPGAISPDLPKVRELLNKFETKGLTLSETNEIKRLYERNIKLDFIKQNLPEGIRRANIIDDAVRQWQDVQAKSLGLKNLPEIRRETRLAKQLLDDLGKEYAGIQGNNAITLTDWIMLSGGDPMALSSFIVKKGLSSKGIQASIAKALGKNMPKQPIIKAAFSRAKMPSPLQPKTKLQIKSPSQLSIPPKSSFGKIPSSEFLKPNEMNKLTKKSNFGKK